MLITRKECVLIRKRGGVRKWTKRCATSVDRRLNSSTIEKDLNLHLFPLGLAWVKGAM